MKKVGYFFFCFLPLIVSVSLQFIITFPAMGLSLIQTCLSNLASGKKPGIYDLVTQLYTCWSSSGFTLAISIAFAITGILVFGFWYARCFEGNFRQSPGTFINMKIIIGLILLVPGLQLLSSVLTGISASFFPGWMDFYEELMESAGFSGKPSVLLVLYAVLLGPVSEELTFRGVTLSAAKRILPFWAANLFQAFLFGVFHMNVIQGIYAFMIGLVLGYVCEKGGSIYLSILLHILFNSWGTFMPSDSVLFKNPLYLSIFFILAVFLAIWGFYLLHKSFHKNNNENTLSTEVNHSQEFSDM